MTDELQRLIDTFERHLYLPDKGPLLATLGTIAANRMNGDPVWLMLVGPPGSLKSELLQTCIGINDVYPVSTLTEAGLLSGTSRRETAPNATGGLLKEIGELQEVP